MLEAISYEFYILKYVPGALLYAFAMLSYGFVI